MGGKEVGALGGGGVGPEDAFFFNVDLLWHASSSLGVCVTYPYVSHWVCV